MSVNLKSKPVMLWCLANIFFAFQFILRLSAGILKDQIIAKYAIDTASFGTLAGFYYLGYAGSQIPLGIMLDRYSFRFITSICVIITGIGTLTFIKAESWNLLLLGRFLIGVGSGIGFLSIAKITKTFFDAKYHAIMLGFAFTFGLLGAVFGITPMKLLFAKFGYSNTFNILALVAFVIAITIFVLGNINTTSIVKEEDSFASVYKLLLNPTILIIGICGGLMVGALEGFADVWALSFFNQVFGMSEMDSANITSFVYFGMCVGGPLLAGIASIIGSINLMIFLTGLFTVVLFLVLFNITALSFTTAAILMFILGILCCYQVLVFTLVSNHVQSKHSGLAIAITNCINMSFGHFFHSVIGKSFEANWDQKINEFGSAIYSSENFISSLSIIPICCFIGQFGFVLLSFRKSHR